MPRQTLYLWKQAPFIRLLIPLMAGIVLQWYCSPPVLAAWIILPLGVGGLLAFNRHTSFLHYSSRWVNGIFVNACMLALGSLVTWHRDIAHQQQWFGNCYHEQDCVTAVLQEPLSEKANSYKAGAGVEEEMRVRFEMYKKRK